MSEHVTPEELERLLRQLQGQDLEAIGRQLGLDLHGPDRNQALRNEVERNPELRRRLKRLALTRPANATCSFCGQPASDNRKMIASPAGAKICSVCLEGFKQPRR